ncbi:zinc finger and SCAN domain-containing protein 12-like isoform X2 [Toxorhynchites rutilus septentrionalis]|uniref:zinc finger and SCAN domain-containing protein 12-like isoform X2 n=1 Tax=Toxorhynchites rutilus septentrionalis TaxID=329112 RepID=UPI0024785AFD|nr:zinc finger and SCAN domain-containing protein 12-like isoform X2 [Toxorhynchites rutilus septentrionalis]
MLTFIHVLEMESEQQAREKILHKYVESPSMSPNNIAKSLGIPRSTVYSVLKRFRERLNVDRKQGSGGRRSNDYNPKRDTVLRMMEQNPKLSMRDVAKKAGVSSSYVQKVKKSACSKSIKNGINGSDYQCLTLQTNLRNEETIQNDNTVRETESTNQADQWDQRSIDVQHEPLESNVKEIDDDQTTCSNNNKNDESSCSEGAPQIGGYPKEVRRIANKCYICDTILKTKSEFDDHLESHRDLLPFKCLQCSTEANPIETSTVAGLNKHFETHHIVFVCSHCPQRYRTWASFTYHVRSTHDKQKFEYHCEFCKKGFDNYKVHRNHVQAHKNLILQRYKCEPCGKLFKTKHYLRKHQKSISHAKLVQNKPSPKITTRKTSEMLSGEKSTDETKRIVEHIIAKSDPDDFDGTNAEKHRSNDNVTEFIQEQIELEPIDIKDELDDDEMDNDMTTYISNN